MYQIKSHEKSQPKDLHWVPSWLPSVEVVGESQFPRIYPVELPEMSRIEAFTRLRADALSPKTAIHGWVDDYKLVPVRQTPGRYLTKFANYAAVVTPDFSLLRGMPRHERIKAVWDSRAVGAFFQSRGLTVIPNIRWATMSDLDFVLEGLPRNSAVAVSTQGLLRDSISRQIFVGGLSTVIQELRPENLIVYGQIPAEVADVTTSCPHLLTFPTNIHDVFNREVR